MSVYYRNKYWLLGDNADDEATRWVAQDERKQILYSSPRAVEMEEIGNHLSPELPIPPEGFLVVAISDIDVEGYGLKLGVAHWGGVGGWLERKGLANEEFSQHDARKADGTALREADFLEDNP